MYNLMKLVKKSIFGGVVRDISRRLGDDDGHLAMAVEKTGSQYPVIHWAPADKRFTDVVRHSKSDAIQAATIRRTAPNKRVICCRAFSAPGPSGFA